MRVRLREFDYNDRPLTIPDVDIPNLGVIGIVTSIRAAPHVRNATAKPFHDLGQRPLIDQRSREISVIPWAGLIGRIVLPTPTIG